MACLLDPRFNQLTFKNKDNALNGQAIIQNELSTYFNQHDNTPVKPILEIEEENRSCSLFSFIQNKVGERKKYRLQVVKQLL